MQQFNDTYFPVSGRWIEREKESGNRRESNLYVKFGPKLTISSKISYFPVSPRKKVVTEKAKFASKVTIS